MPPKIVTAKFPTLNTVRMDDGAIVKVSDEQMGALKLGDSMEVSDVKQEIKSEAPKEAPRPQQTAIARTDKEAPSRAGYGQPLTEYDLNKDRQIAASGIVQALIQSNLVLKLSEVEPAAKQMLDVVKRLSQKE